MAPLTAEELVKHPAYPTVEWELTPTTSGKQAVAQTRRGGPINLHYELHGTGPVKLVVSLKCDSQPIGVQRWH